MRLPPVTANASGSLLPSTRRWCLEPGRPLSTGLGPVSEPPFSPAPGWSRRSHATTRSHPPPATTRAPQARHHAGNRTAQDRARFRARPLPVGDRAHLRLAAPVQTTARPLRPPRRHSRGVPRTRLLHRLLPTTQEHLIVKGALRRRLLDGCAATDLDQLGEGVLLGMSSTMRISRKSTRAFLPIP